MKRRVLILEDDSDLQAGWQRSIADFNQQGEVQFEALQAFNAADAEQILGDSRLDCAVLDLRVPDDSSGGRATAPVGERVIKLLRDRHHCPLVIVSGFSNELGEMFRGRPTKVLDKSRTVQGDSLSWLSSQEGIMSALEDMKARLDEQISRFFYDSLWPRWDSDWKDDLNQPDLVTVITRQMAGHIEASLSGDATDHHPEEFYIRPPLQTALDVGDVLEITDRIDVPAGMYVVLTPRCDLARNIHPRHVLIAPCKDASDEWAQLQKSLSSENAARSKRASKVLGDRLTQNCGNSRHFLVPVAGSGPWFVQFGDVQTIREEKPELQALKVMSIASAFVPNLVQRFGAYQSRIGQPTIDIEKTRDSSKAPEASGS